MTNAEFKGFKEAVIKADAKSHIWWMGWAFLHSTNKQIDILRPILAKKFGTVNGEIHLPSGIIIKAK